MAICCLRIQARCLDIFGCGCAADCQLIQSSFLNRLGRGRVVVGCRVLIVLGSPAGTIDVGWTVINADQAFQKRQRAYKQS